MKKGQIQLENHLKGNKAVVLDSEKSPEPKKLSALKQISTALGDISKGIYLF